MACGLSVYRDLQDVRRLQARVAAHRGKPVAAGELTSELGVTKPTPTRKESSHTTWWLPDGVDPSPQFTIVSEGGDAP